MITFLTYYNYEIYKVFINHQHFALCHLSNLNFLEKNYFLPNSRHYLLLSENTIHFQFRFIKIFYKIIINIMTEEFFINIIFFY